MWMWMMARLTKKQQQDKRELLSSLNHVNNCIGSTHAAENRKYKSKECSIYYEVVVHSVFEIKTTEFLLCTLENLQKMFYDEHDVLRSRSNFEND